MLSTTLFAYVVLASIRNLSVLQLVHADAIANFVLLNAKGLLLPLRVFSFGVVCLIISVYFWLWGIFGCLAGNLIFFPCAALILPLIVQTYASGVKALYQSNLSVPGLSDAWDRKVQALIVPAASR